MSKLYRVTVEFEMVVEARDEDHAWALATTHAPSAVPDCQPDVRVGSQILSIADLPEHWDGMCLPYGGYGDKRIKDIIKETA